MCPLKKGVHYRGSIVQNGNIRLSPQIQDKAWLNELIPYFYLNLGFKMWIRSGYHRAGDCVEVGFKRTGKVGKYCVISLFNSSCAISHK